MEGGGEGDRNHVDASHITHKGYAKKTMKPLE